MSMPIHGELDLTFARLERVLSAHLEVGLDVGFGFSLYYRGRAVADLWAGYTDRARTLPWTEHTLVPLTSITKTVLSATVLCLAERGVIDIDAPVARYWPAFAAHGKSGVTVAQVLSHQSGIPFFPAPLRLEDELAWTPIVRQIESLSPIWPPGGAHGYHAIVLGFLLFELLQRVTQREVDSLVRELISEPFALDLHLALDESDRTRVAEMISRTDDRAPVSPPPELRDYVAGFSDHSTLLYRATFGSTAMTDDDVNDPRYHLARRPAAYATASATARFFAAMISPIKGRRLLSAETVESLVAERASGLDRVFCLPTRFSLGFMLPGGRLWPDFGRPAFGHIGSAGALAFADPEREIAFAFLPNQRKSIYEVPDRRAQALVEETYRILNP